MSLAKILDYIVVHELPSLIHRPPRVLHDGQFTRQASLTASFPRTPTNTVQGKLPPPEGGSSSLAVAPWYLRTTNASPFGVICDDSTMQCAQPRRSHRFASLRAQTASCAVAPASVSGTESARTCYDKRAVRTSLVIRDRSATERLATPEKNTENLTHVE